MRSIFARHLRNIDQIFPLILRKVFRSDRSGHWMESAHRWNIRVSLCFPNIHCLIQNDFIYYLCQKKMCLSEKCCHLLIKVAVYYILFVTVVTEFRWFIILVSDSVKPTSPLPQIFQYNTYYGLQQTKSTTCILITCCDLAAFKHLRVLHTPLLALVLM
jgi:hypothetical protein